VGSVSFDGERHIELPRTVSVGHEAQVEAADRRFFSRMAPAETTGWKRGLSTRLRKIADTMHVDESLADTVAPELPAPPPLPPIADPNNPDARRDALAALITECYPTVAPKVLALAHDGADASSDDWIIVARLLYDAHMHRVGGPTETARMRALVATFAQALEAQARSSARLAGYHDTEHDNASTIEGDEPGTLVWQHYLCPTARLARQAVHGEAVGNWLSALGELWGSTKALVDEVESRLELTADTSELDPPDVPPSGGSEDPQPDATELVLRARVALARVEELALW
jgi:hypothetical protein